jgi:hypothetical protein
LWESAIDSRSGFFAKIRGPATFNFCNTICTPQTSRGVASPPRELGAAKNVGITSAAELGAHAVEKGKPHVVLMT